MIKVGDKLLCIKNTYNHNGELRHQKDKIYKVDTIGLAYGPGKDFINLYVCCELDFYGKSFTTKSNGDRTYLFEHFILLADWRDNQIDKILN